MKYYNIETLTVEEYREMISSADDRHHNQIRVTENGKIFISSETGAENIEGLRFRLETYDAGNGYVGPEAAADVKYITDMHATVLKCWNTGRRGYIDFY